MRQNFQLQVSTAQTTVEVSAEPLNAIAASSARRRRFDRTRISDLPIVGNNVLSLMNVLPGVRLSTSSGPGLFGPQFSTINGLDLNSVNVTRDGLTRTIHDSAPPAMSRPALRFHMAAAPA